MDVGVNGAEQTIQSIGQIVEIPVDVAPAKYVGVSAPAAVDLITYGLAV